MIDLHCHILPGLDDGARLEQDMLDMAEAAVHDGISVIVATPHHQNGSYLNTKQEIIHSVDLANGLLQENNINLSILPGQECRMYGEIIEDLQKGDILPLNETKYLFIEFPSNQMPRYSKTMLYDIQLAGYIPIIVHPERNQVFLKKPDMLYEFVKNGSLTQVTAASLAGKFGKTIGRFSLDLIEARLTHFVASDAHNVTNRSFNMTEAYNVISDEFDEDTVYYFKENAGYLIEDKHVMIDQPNRIKVKKKLFGLF